MELVKDTPFEVAWITWSASPERPCLTIVVKGTFDIDESGTCDIAKEQALPTGDVHHDDDVDRSVRCESDFAYLKPQGEVLLAGSCRPPGGRPATFALAAFKVGPVGKRMAVIGDRHFKGLICGQSEPVPFTSMPLCWERSFGGARIKDNPVGLGLGKSIVDGKKVIRLPNIEDPDNLIKGRFQRPKPVGATAIPRSWQQRTGHLGTYDAEWQRTRWPCFPKDFQWAYFNAAPPEQRINGYFRGDEEISLLHLHPEHDRVRCRLPGLGARIFLIEGGGKGLRTVNPDLDTITIDSDAGQAICTWRAVTEVCSENLEELSHLFVVHEPIGEKRDPGKYREWFEQRLAEIEAEDKEHEPEEPPPSTAEAPSASETASVIVSEELVVSTECEEEREPGPRYVGKLTLPPIGVVALPDPVPLESSVMAPELATAIIETPFVDVDLDDAETEMMDLGTIMTMVQSQATEVMDAKDLDELFAREAALLGQPLSFEEQLNSEKEDLMQTMLFEPTSGGADAPVVAPVDGPGSFAETSIYTGGAPVAAPTVEPEPGASTSKFMTSIFEPQSLSAPQPPREGLAEPPGPPLESLEEPTIEMAEWAGMQPSSETLEEPTMEMPPSADFIPAAGPTEEQQALRERVSAALKSGEGCAGWDLTESDLSEMDLRKGDFTGAVMVRARLTATNLEGAVFKEANLSGADLAGAQLRGASFTEADLSEANGPLLRFEENDLDGMVAIEAAFVGAVFKKVTLRGAELIECNLENARFEQGCLDQADFSAAMLDGARFVDCSMEDTDVSCGASLKKAQAEGCIMTNLRADEGSDLTDAVFRGSKIQGGTFGTSNLTGANLALAWLDEASFTGSTLVRATLTGCSLRNARFDDADLTEAALVAADLHESRLEGALLRRADLRGCNFYGAEFLNADVQGAKLDGAVLTGTKLK